MEKKKDGLNTKPDIAPEFQDLAPSSLEEKDPIDEKILRLRKVGRTYRQIAKELHVSLDRITRVLKEAREDRRIEDKEREQITPILFDDEFIASLIEWPFDFCAKRYGDFWKLSSEERTKLAILTNRVATKYLPLWLERYKDEVALTITFGTLIYPRYLITKELIEKAKQEAQRPKTESQPTA